MKHDQKVEIYTSGLFRVKFLHTYTEMLLAHRGVIARAIGLRMVILGGLAG